MANCTSGLGVVHGIVNFTKKEEVIETLKSCLVIDNDLSENEEYYREDTLELGYESEVDRIVDEAIKELGFPTDIESFTALLNKVTDSISDQEFFCVCELDVIEAGKNKASYVFAYGGNYDN